MTKHRALSFVLCALVALGTLVVVLTAIGAKGIIL